VLAKGLPAVANRTLSSAPKTGSHGPNEKYLWQRVKAGNELSFSLLYKRYTKRLYNYGMHHCHDHNLVMDCLQEIFTSIWDNRTTLSDVYAVNTYLFTSFRRLLHKKLTWRRRFSLSLDRSKDVSFEIVLPIEYIIERDEDAVVRIDRLRRCIGSLTKRQREALFLRFYNGLNYAEVASIMKLQVDSVYNLISKSIDALRTLMVK
jgi:RNA polymerase sigma factor (sigma-70 family)